MQKIPESIGSKYRFIIVAAERAKQLQNNANLLDAQNKMKARLETEKARLTK